MTRRVCVIPGDDSAPEAVLPALGVLKVMELDIDYTVLPAGEEGQAAHGHGWYDFCKQAIDATETTLFGSTSGKTPALGYLRYGKDTYANVRPVKYLPGALSPLKHPEGIDFVIVREGSEDLYSGVEGELETLAPLGFINRLTRRPMPASGGLFAIKVITEAASRRVVEFAFRLAKEREEQLGRPAKVTAACKYNMLLRTDGLFREVAHDVASKHPEIAFDDYIVDDFARRIVAEPHNLDVVVMPNLYGDILSDEASALIGGLGLSPSGCYGDDFAYFEPVHGTAPDILGTGKINPTATLLSAAMMLEHLGMAPEATRLRDAITAVYAKGDHLTPDQGGSATATEFCAAVMDALG